MYIMYIYIYIYVYYVYIYICIETNMEIYIDMIYFH